METVTLIRILRDGSETREVMPRWLADQIVANVPTGEPNTARLRVVSGSHPQPARFTRRQDAYGIAMLMAGQMVGSATVH